MRQYKWVSFLAFDLTLLSVIFSSLVLARPQNQSLAGAPGTMTH